MPMAQAIPQVGNWQGGSIDGQIQSTFQPASWPNQAQVMAARGVVPQQRSVQVSSPAIVNHPDNPQSAPGMQRNRWTPSYILAFIRNKVTPDQLGSMSNESGNLNHELHEEAHMYRPSQSCINGWAGLRQHAFAQTFGGVTDDGATKGQSGGGIWPPNENAGYDGRSLILTPPAIPRPTTSGVRSVAGVTARGRFGQASNRRVPATFIPTGL